MADQELTEAQKKAMRHALGEDRLGANRTRKSYRNWFVASVDGADFALWSGLVSIEYAALVHVENGMARFTVTEAGRAALSTGGKDD